VSGRPLARSIAHATRRPHVERCAAVAWGVGTAARLHHHDGRLAARAKMATLAALGDIVCCWGHSATRTAHDHDGEPECGGPERASRPRARSRRCPLATSASTETPDSQPSQLTYWPWCVPPTFDTSASVTRIAAGVSASPGAAIGQAVFDSARAVELAAAGAAVILVRRETNPDDLPRPEALPGDEQRWLTGEITVRSEEDLKSFPERTVVTRLPVSSPAAGSAHDLAYLLDQLRDRGHLGDREPCGQAPERSGQLHGLAPLTAGNADGRDD
jgi:hypothetical protein